ncbi:MAG: hypothetical protein RL766_2274, partial [Bacteroidota bacterium]
EGKLVLVTPSSCKKSTLSLKMPENAVSQKKDALVLVANPLITPLSMEVNFMLNA